MRSRIELVRQQVTVKALQAQRRQVAQQRDASGATGRPLCQRTTDKRWRETQIGYPPPRIHQRRLVTASPRPRLQRWITAIAIAIACVWLAVTAAAPGALTAKVTAPAEEPHHHHHGDGTVHFDDSADSHLHGAAAHADLPPAIPMAAVGFQSWARGQRPCWFTGPAPDEPDPDGPFRPPRASA